MACGLAARISAAARSISDACSSPSARITFARGQHLVEFVLAQHRPQRGLRQLAGRIHEILHLQDRLGRVDDTEIHNRIDLDRDVVARDHVLAWHVEYDGAQVDPYHLLDAGQDDHQSRPLHPPETPNHEHHAALILAQDAQAGDYQHDDDKYECEAAEFKHAHSPCQGSTSRIRSCRARTRSALPRGRGVLLRTRQCSLCTRAQPSCSISSRVTPVAPTSSSAPVTTGRRRARSAMLATKKLNSALATATGTISIHGSP